MTNAEICKIIGIAENAGKILLKYFNKNLKLELKSHFSDFRTIADLESEKVIIKNLSRLFPKFNILSEERGLIQNGSKTTFIIDPLDGTNNFTLGIPNFSISIGLVEENRILSGVIHNPILKRTYHSIRGGGAYLNGKKIRVNKERNLNNCTVAYTRGYAVPDRRFIKLFSDLLIKKDIKRELNSWSPAYDFCMLASGKIEAIANEKNEMYDFIAGKIIAREAGALITDFNDKRETDEKSNKFLISNGTSIHQEIISVL